MMSHCPSSSAREGRVAWASGSAERQFLHRDGPGFASPEADPEELAAAMEGDCLFEIFRADQERMTSTLFAGGDWRWRLVTTEGVILAEAAGYPNEGLCRAAVLVLQRRAATAPIALAGQTA